MDAVGRRDQLSTAAAPARRRISRSGAAIIQTPVRGSRAGCAHRPADEASQELARFDSEAGDFIAPFPAILLRIESASSSEVENLTAGAKQVALASIGAARSENARLIVANTRAMEAAPDSAVHRLMDVVLAQPVITAKVAARGLGASDVSAHAAINRLAEAGVLTQAGGGARNRIWQAPDVISALDAFASRARRGRA